MEVNPMPRKKEAEKPAPPEPVEPLLSIPELQKETGVSDFVLIAYLSSTQQLKKYRKHPDEMIMTLEEFKTDLNQYKRKKIKIER
jgi:uncharacterized short protein YbdD (DUF466 family)